MDWTGLFLDIVAYDPHRRRTNHLLKVTGYAMVIGEGEGMDSGALQVLRLAALLHDIGIKPSKEKHGSGAGEFQQIEGPPLARNMLAKYGPTAETVDRVCYLIAHHHDYDNIDGPDYQALVEADFLVNCDEKDMDAAAVIKIRDAIFRTKTGTRLLNSIFAL